MFLLWDGVKALTLHSENDKQAGLFRALDRRLNLNRNTRVIYFKRLYEGGFDYEEKRKQYEKEYEEIGELLCRGTQDVQHRSHQLPCITE